MKVSNNYFEHENLKRHKNYDLSESIYITSRKPISFRCNIHNKVIEVKRAVDLHKLANKCLECEEYFKEFYRKEKFIAKANRKFNSKFDYSKVEDYHSESPVTIGCPVHGDYQYTPFDHLRSEHGCPSCGIDHVINLAGHSKTCYVTKCKSDTSNVYIIKIIGNNEVFYKIGITSLTVEKRFKRSPFPKEYEISIEHIFENLEKGLAFDFETLIHRSNKEYKYKPLLKFS